MFRAILFTLCAAAPALLPAATVQEVLSKMLLKNQDNHFRYKVFGLHITSDILLPELLAENDKHAPAEASIIIGKTPAHIDGATEQAQRYQLANNHFLFQIPGVGSYYVTHGNRIVVEPAEQAKEVFVRLFLLGTAFGALLMQRGILPIHGSAVVFGGR